ncbi:hypothetical protein PG993_014586 [Apiospora rasikravindrae]|uniref:Uncharacterized protein n=1 Tax=Apiospora rasikravindrae TaxID=990691 RepID=A0ABR1RNC2_9PEZI
MSPCSSDDSTDNESHDGKNCALDGESTSKALQEEKDGQRLGPDEPRVCESFDQKSPGAHGERLYLFRKLGSDAKPNNFLNCDSVVVITQDANDDERHSRGDGLGKPNGKG